MPRDFHHITLNVSDLERSRAFYQGVLGLTVDQDIAGYKLRFRLDGTTARLVLGASLPGTPRATGSASTASAWTTSPSASRSATSLAWPRPLMPPASPTAASKPTRWARQ
jgi:catechol 2,3-dioxygenase-like lactoylglutathione lyase family enzyme